MKKYSISILCFFLILVSFDGYSQRKKRNVEYSGFFDTYYWRGPVSYSLGLTQPFYSGDLCDNPIDCMKIKPGFSIGLGYKVWPKVYFGGDFQYYSYGATSNNLTTTTTSFANTTYGLQLYGRYYFIDDIVHRHQDVWKKPRKIKPYFLIGFNTMFMQVNTSYKGLDVVGNRSFAFAVPAGLGLSFNFSHRVNLLTEFVANYCFSDDLDGFNKAIIPNSSHNDFLYQFNIKIQYAPRAPRLRKKKIKFSGKLGDMPGDGTSQPAQYNSAPTDKAVDTTPEDSSGEDNTTPAEDSDNNNQYDKTDDGWGDEPVKKPADDGWN